MIEVGITLQMIDAARTKAAEMGALNNSILRGQGNIAGFIGEQVALHVMGGKWDNTYNYDIVLDDGTKVDVKTKQTSVEPKMNYECSIHAGSRKQDCDLYAFVRVKKDLTTAWFLGVKNRGEYFREASYLKKGDKDPSNNFTVRSDCYNLPISQLDAWTNETTDT